MSVTAVRTCALCGRVGTRGLHTNAQGRTTCRKTRACVIRLCDKIFLDPPERRGWGTGGGDGIWLGNVMQNIKFYGVVSDLQYGAATVTLEIPTMRT